MQDNGPTVDNELVHADRKELAAVRLNEIHEWRQVVATTIHFSDMIIRTRSIAATTIGAIYGAAAVAATREGGLDPVAGVLSAPALLVIFGMMALIAVFLVDYFYYFKLLVAAVLVNHRIEEDYNINSRLTTQLSASVSLSTSNMVIVGFYGLPIVLGSIFVLLITPEFTAETKVAPPTEVLEESQ